MKRCHQQCRGRRGRSTRSMSPPPGRCLLHLPPSPTPTLATQKPQMRTMASPAAGHYGDGKNAEALPRRRRPLTGHPLEGPCWAPPLTLLLTATCFIHPTHLCSCLLTARLPLQLNMSLKFRLHSAATRQAVSLEGASPQSPRARPATTAGATFVLWDATWTNTMHTSQRCAPPWWSATPRRPACTQQTPTPPQLKDRFSSTRCRRKRRNSILVQVCHRAASRTP